MEQGFVKGNLLHNVFELTVFLKGINGLWEIAAGLFFLLVREQTIYQFIASVAPSHIASQFSTSTKYFIAFYFLFYGTVNLFLIFSLYKGKLWAYPVAIVGFSVFIIYQCFRIFDHHSGLLVLFTLFDIFLVALTALEYKRVLENLQKPEK